MPDSLDKLFSGAPATPTPPKKGQTFLDDHDQIMVYDVQSASPQWMPFSPMWKIRRYLMRNSDGDAVGIFKGAIDTNQPVEFALADEEDNIHILKAEDISKAEFGTISAFDTLPVLEIDARTMGGILLKFPD